MHVNKTESFSDNSNVILPNVFVQHGVIRLTKNDLLAQLNNKEKGQLFDVYERFSNSHQTFNANIKFSSVLLLLLLLVLHTLHKTKENNCAIM